MFCAESLSSEIWLIIVLEIKISSKTSCKHGEWELKFILNYCAEWYIANWHGEVS